MQVEHLTSPNHHNPSVVLDCGTTKHTISGAAMSAATTNFPTSMADLSSTIMPQEQDAPRERSKATQMLINYALTVYHTTVCNLIIVINIIYCSLL